MAENKDFLDALNRKQDALEVATEISLDNDNPVASSAVAKMFDKYSDGQWNISYNVDTQLDANSDNPVSNKTLVEEFDKKQDKITVDEELSNISENPVQNKVISAKIASIDDNFERILRETNNIKKELDCKQNIIDIDTTIDINSDLPVSSSAVAKVLDQYTDGQWNVKVDVDDKLDLTSDKPVQNRVITNALNNKQDKITIDSALSAISANPVENRAIFEAIQECKEAAKTINSQEFIRLLNTKQDALEVVASVEEENDYPVASSAVFKALSRLRIEIEHYVEVEGGKIDRILVNGILQEIVNKEVNIFVPTKTSDITNDSDFITHEDIKNKADKSEIPTKVTDLSDAGNYALISEVEAEAELREAADCDLQSQIDAISAATDVRDVVSTKSELDIYDKTKLGDNDIIKVLNDESQDGAITYYRFHSAQNNFELLGATGPYYTKSEANLKFVDNTDSRLSDERYPLAHRHDISDIDNFPTDIAKDTDLEALGNELRAKDSEIEEILQTKADASVLDDYATNTALTTAKNEILDFAESQHTAILGKLESDYTETKDLAPVALSGDYSDLENVPTKVSEFENDENFVKKEDADATYGTIKKISINDEELPNVEGVVNIEGQAPVYHEIDEVVTENSGNLVTSGAVYSAVSEVVSELDAAKDIISSNATRIGSVESNLSTVEANLETKANSATTLAGYGITDAKIEGKTITLGETQLTVETDVPVEDVTVNGESIVQNKVANLQTKTPGRVSGKQVGKLGIDDNPTQDSNNLVRSGGVKTALDDKVDKTGAIVNNTMDIKSTNDNPMPILYLRDKNNSVLGQVEAYNGQVGIGPSWEAGLRIGNSLPRPLYQGVEVALMEDLEDIGGASSWNDLSDKPSTIAGFGITDAYTKIEADETFAKAADYASLVTDIQSVDTKISTFLGTESDTLEGLKDLIAQAEESDEISALEGAIGSKLDKETADGYYQSKGNYLASKGVAPTNLNSTTIDYGVYNIENQTLLGVPNELENTALYGSFTQFPGTYKAQMLILSGSGVSECKQYVRRYLTGSSSWTEWTKTPVKTSDLNNDSGFITIEDTTEVDLLDIDANPTQNSTNLVLSGGVYAKIEEVRNAIPAQLTADTVSNWGFASTEYVDNKVPQIEYATITDITTIWE